MEMTFSEQLKQAGLTQHQAALYETLLKSGSIPARKATLEAGVPRTLGYAVLEQLIELGLVKKDDSPVAKYSAAHPNVLQEKIEVAAKNAERAAIALKASLPDLASAFNLSTGRPGVQFFEGMEGIKQVLQDSLTAKSEICAYIDNESIAKYIPDLNREYVASRKKLGIKRKNIATDTQENRFAIEGFLPGLTEWRLVPWPATPINTIVQIYDNKVTYFTLGSEHLIGVIITDPFIYEFHKRQFDYLWQSTAVFAWPE